MAETSQIKMLSDIEPHNQDHRHKTPKWTFIAASNRTTGAGEADVELQKNSLGGSHGETARLTLTCISAGDSYAVLPAKWYDGSTIFISSVERKCTNVHSPLGAWRRRYGQDRRKSSESPIPTMTLSSATTTNHQFYFRSVCGIWTYL